PKERDAKELRVKVEKSGNNQLNVSINLAGAQNKAPPDLFVEGPAEWNLLPARFEGRDGERLHYKLDLSRAPADADFLGNELRYTLSTGSSGIEFRH
ncbi:MAG: hypothetical protein AAF412_04365, partial [Pseudomonadota bacterium]